MGHFERIEATTTLWRLRRAIASRALRIGTDNRFVAFRVPSRRLAA